LQKLTLWSIETATFRRLLPKLKPLPRLSSLTIKSTGTFEDFKNTYHCIFQLLNLKYVISATSVYPTPRIIHFLPIATNNQFSPIQYLFIHHHCNFSELARIISYTPQLYHLYILETLNSDSTIEISSLAVKKSELQIWSLPISRVQRIPAGNCVLAFLKHDQSTQYG